jgi:hypothetical protein
MATNERLHAKKYVTKDNTEFLEPCTFAADALLEIGTAIISVVSSFDKHLSQINTSCVPKFCFQSVYCYLVLYFLIKIPILKCFKIELRS